MASMSNTVSNLGDKEKWCIMSHNKNHQKHPYHDARHLAGVGCGGLKDEGRMPSLSGQYVDPVLEH